MKPRSRRLRKKSGGTTELYQVQGQVQGPTSWLAAPPIPDQGTPVVPAPGAPKPIPGVPTPAKKPGLFDNWNWKSMFSSNKPESGTAKEPGIFDNFASKLTGIFSAKTSVGGTKKRKRNNKSKRKGKGKK